MADKSEYLPHIDGLRAVSVLAVLLYHLDLGYVTGGFVGVDVFFVISGFLISKILYRDIKQGDLSIVRFYERRCRRILPAYFAITFACLCFGLIYFFHRELTDLSVSAIYSTFFSANIYFYLYSDYFAPAATTQPLLHYWSLAVEEQFYVLFPPLLWFLHRVAPRYFSASLGLLVLISLASAEYAARNFPEAAFYLLPFRAWELGLGSLLALPNLRLPTGRVLVSLAGPAGVAAILFAAITFDRDTVFPGLNALLPCGGALLVIWAGGANSLSWLLSSAPALFVGRISYSLYLVHWPLIVFFKYRFPHVDQTAGAVMIFVAAIFLAWVSYRFVETPFRSNRVVWTRGRIFAGSAGVLSATLAICLVVVSEDGFPGRLPMEVRSLLEYRFDREAAYRDHTCFLYPGETADQFDLDSCMPSDSSRSAVLWGDSFAAHFYPGFKVELGKAGYSLGQFTTGGCSPILGMDLPPQPNCKAINEFVFHQISTNVPKLVILSASWNTNPRLMKMLNETIDRLLLLNTRVILLGQGPRYREKVPTIIAQRRMIGDQSTLSNFDMIPGVASSMLLFEGQFGNKRGVTYISPVEEVCGQVSSCPMMANENEPIQWDIGHLTAAGSYIFARKLVAAMRLPAIVESGENN